MTAETVYKRALKVAGEALKQADLCDTTADIDAWLGTAQNAVYIANQAQVMVRVGSDA